MRWGHESQSSLDVLLGEVIFLLLLSVQHQSHLINHSTLTALQRGETLSVADDAPADNNPSDYNFILSTVPVCHSADTPSPPDVLYAPARPLGRGTSVLDFPLVLKGRRQLLDPVSLAPVHQLSLFIASPRFPELLRFLISVVPVGSNK